jgi:hypothetical protein
VLFDSAKAVLDFAKAKSNNVNTFLLKTQQKPIKLNRMGWNKANMSLKMDGGGKIALTS